MYPRSPPWEPMPYSNHESEAASLLGSYAILTGIQLPTLLRSILPSSSVSNSLLRLQDREDGGTMLLLKCQQLPVDMDEHYRILWIFNIQTVRASALTMMKVLASSQQQMAYGITNFYSVRSKECKTQAKMSGLDKVRYGWQYMPAPFL